MKKFITSAVLFFSLATLQAGQILFKGVAAVIEFKLIDSAGAAITSAVDIDCLIGKNGGVLTAADDCTDGGDECTETTRGMYKFTATATELNTAGYLLLDCEDTVKSSQVYTEKIPVFDNPSVNVVQINGNANAASGLAFYGDSLRTGQVNGDNATTTFFDTSLTSLVTDFYNDAALAFTSGNLDNQFRRIVDYADGVVTVDTTVSSTGASSTTQTLSSVVAGSGNNRLLMCAIGGRNGTLTATTDATFNTTETMDLVFNESQAANIWLEIYRLYNPSNATADVVFTLDNADGVGMSCTSFTGVKQLTGVGTPLASQGTTGTDDGNETVVGVANGSLGYDAIAIETTVTTLAPDSAQSSQSNQTADTLQTGTSTDVSAASIVMGWSWTETAHDWAHIAVPLLPAKTITLSPALTSAPADTDNFVILPHGYGSVRPTVATRTLDVDVNDRIDVGSWLGTAAATPTVAGVPEVDITHQVGGLVPTPTTTGVPDVNVERWLDTLVTLGAGAPDVNIQSTDNIALSVQQKADVNTEADLALTDINLDHLLFASVTGAEVVDDSVFAFLTAKAATADWDTFDNTTDSLEALRDNQGGGGGGESLLQNTTITGLSSQTVFDLTAGSADNDAYNGAIAIITDASTATQKAFAVVHDYAGGTKTITLGADPGIFVMANGDTIDIVASVLGVKLGELATGPISGFPTLPEVLLSQWYERYCKTTTTTSTFTIFNCDAGVAVHKMIVGDAAGIYTKGEAGAP